MTTCSYFDNIVFDILVAGGTQCHFITLLPLYLGLERFQDFSFS